jgi:molecular chaperone IbpA
VSGAARNHFALRRISVCAVRAFHRSGARPSASTAFSTSRNPPIGQARTTIPPYNIERLGEDRYQISLAVAGFSPNEISVTPERNVVTIEGSRSEKTEREYTYHGISIRAFGRQFNLADYVPLNSATFDNGLLKIEVVREIPEAMKPRRIAINGAAPDNLRTLSEIDAKPRPATASVLTRRRMEENMRPTTATDDNVSDSQAILHRAPSSSTPKTWLPILPNAGREAGHPRLLGLGRDGDRLLSHLSVAGFSDGVLHAFEG